MIWGHLMRCDAESLGCYFCKCLHMVMRESKKHGAAALWTSMNSGQRGGARWILDPKDGKPQAAATADATAFG